ncbi:hypothetical protein [Rickettsia endosymbiont of Cardiosporidium cionae]|uniref:hypothetical protein n=1 Tax=Rickettsia endosymbiont of Cardiosporidium cionae TaxID=2777155 RepID=UPI0018932BDF|nr:hypothetical protein [Rickettsia endosymbiont of Cardiosporidium cionae]KAF8818503.1 hypothetical protein IHI24_000597 [Rickettsia endosymbiont of Cardiosporidium cionae]
MSGKILELIIFAVIAFMIINRLISILGRISEKNHTEKSKRSFFGENNSKYVKDVTHTSIQGDSNTKTITDSITEQLPEMEESSSKSEIMTSLKLLKTKIPNFDINNFVLIARKVLTILLSNNNKKNFELEKFVDKRYINDFRKSLQTYGNYIASDIKNLNIKIVEIYIFGNNAFIKILFFGDNITDLIEKFNEEWTFTKSFLSDDNVWYLSNVERYT